MRSQENDQAHSTGGKQTKASLFREAGGWEVVVVACMPDPWVLVPRRHIQQPVAPACLSNVGTLGVGDLVRGEAGNEKEKGKAGRKGRRRKADKMGGGRPWTNYSMSTVEIKICNPDLRSTCFPSP